MAYKPKVATMIEGGTGVTSLTNHALIASNGTTLFSLGVGATNSILIGNTGGNPSFTTTGTPSVASISFDSGSNSLANYVQGTFTPTITNTGSAPTVGYAGTNGRYTRIGNRIIVSSQIILNSYSAGTGDVQFSALPFTSNNTSNNNHTGPLILSNVTFGASVQYYSAQLTPNSTSADMVGTISNAASLNLVAANVASNSLFNISLAYEV